MNYRQTAGSGRTAHRSDLEILEAIKLLRERNPSEPVTGYKLKTYFGEGHVNTYKSAIERLTLGGALQGDDDSDPALDLILQDAKQLVATIRKTASAGFNEQVEQLKAQQASEMAKLQESIERLTQANRELTLTGKQQEALNASQAEQLSETKAEITSLKDQLESQRQANHGLMIDNEKLRISIETLTSRTAHYETELTSMKELEAEAIQILKTAYERQLGDMRGEIDSLTKTIDVGREVRERVSNEAARTLEAKKQLEREVHELTLRLQDQNTLKQQLEEQQALNQQLSSQLVESKASANQWREALTLANTGTICQVVYASSRIIVIHDQKLTLVTVAGPDEDFESLDSSQVVALSQGYLFPKSDYMRSRDQFDRVSNSDWEALITSVYHV